MVVGSFKIAETPWPQELSTRHYQYYRCVTNLRKQQLYSETGRRTVHSENKLQESSTGAENPGGASNKSLFINVRALSKLTWPRNWCSTLNELHESRKRWTGASAVILKPWRTNGTFRKRLRFRFLLWPILCKRYSSKLNDSTGQITLHKTTTVHSPVELTTDHI